MTNVIELPSRKQRLVDAWAKRKEEMRATELYRETMAEKARTRQQLEANIRHSIACLYGLISSECADAYSKDANKAKNASVDRLEVYLTAVVMGVTNGGKSSAFCRND